MEMVDRVAGFKRMLNDCPPMWYTVGQGFKSDPWIVNHFRCLNCTTEYLETQREGHSGTRCPHCFDLDKEFKWERTTNNNSDQK